MRFFDPNDQLLITRRKLPHWAQDGCVVFITWRTADSMPKPVLARWRDQRDRWLRLYGIDPDQPDWKVRVQALPPELMTEYHARFTHRWHEALDSCRGRCALMCPEIADIVQESLLHFDGDRYEMFDLVVMPNHVHLLVSFPEKTEMLKQCDSWKHFTAQLINRRLGTRGRFWQQDAFDHLVRHEAQFRRLRAYIAENPWKAGLRARQARYWSREGTSRGAR